jgi:hypothetical protein
MSLVKAVDRLMTRAISLLVADAAMFLKTSVTPNVLISLT